MAHNALIRVGPTWLEDSTVTRLEFETFDTRQFQGINGDLGGTWAPSSQIILGGSGLRTTGLFEVVGTGTLTGPVTAADLTMSSTNKVKLASRSLTRVQATTPAPVDATQWLVAADMRWFCVGTGSILYIPLDAPSGSTLTAVSVYILPTAGHGALPAVMPSITVKYVTTGGAATSLGTQADTSANVAAFELDHAITLSGLSSVVNKVTRRYHVALTMESGANSIASSLLLATSATFTTTSMDDGAA